MKYTLSEIVALTAARVVGGACVVSRGGDVCLSEVSTDSRAVPLNSHATLFVAIVGPNRDGHNFVAKSYRQGVRHFLVEHAVDLSADAVQIVVADTMEALQILAAANRDRYNGPLVAITGSNGKTTLKEWIAQLWPESAGKLLRSPRSYNSQLGVALSLLLIEGDERLVVIEAGISAPGEMERLERMIRPTIGVLTNIGEAHSENFADNAHKESEKRKLFLHTDKLIDNTLEGRSLVELLAEVYAAVGVTPRQISELRPLAMRLEELEGVDSITILNDSYSNDPVSLTLALDRLSQSAEGVARVVILSDVPQNSESADGLYRRVAQMLVTHSVTQFIGVGAELSRHRDLFPTHSRFYPTTEALVQDRTVRGLIPSGSTLLIKGGRSFGFERVSRLFERRCHTTVMEVNLSAMGENLRHYRARLAPGVRLMVMVKAYSYGHGAVEVARFLEHSGVDYLGVAFADEGVALREGGITMPIVVLNSDPGSFSVMADYGLEPEIYSLGSLRSYIDMAASRGIMRAPIHLKLDTGMHRLGFLEGQTDELIAELGAQQSVVVRSVFSHLAASEDSAEDRFTSLQVERFEAMSSRIIASLPYGEQVIRHIDNSAGIERHAAAHFDMVRLGIGLYAPENPSLRPVATLRTQIVQIKDLPAGETVGYNRRAELFTPRRIAIIPIGYADGIDRRLGLGHWSVSVGGVLCPTIGNICMDTTIIDVSGAPLACEGSEVIIFGETPTATDMAHELGTISYEILTRVAHRIRRVYIID